MGAVCDKSVIGNDLYHHPSQNFMYCSECGVQLKEDSKFCSKCGHKINGKNSINHNFMDLNLKSTVSIIISFALFWLIAIYHTNIIGMTYIDWLLADCSSSNSSSSGIPEWDNALNDFEQDMSELCSQRQSEGYGIILAMLISFIVTASYIFGDKINGQKWKKQAKDFFEDKIVLSISTVALFLGLILPWWKYDKNQLRLEYSGFEVLFSLAGIRSSLYNLPLNSLANSFDLLTEKQEGAFSLGQQFFAINNIIFFLIPWIFLLTFYYSWHSRNENRTLTNKAGWIHLSVFLLYILTLIPSNNYYSGENTIDNLFLNRIGIYVAGISGLGLIKIHSISMFIFGDNNDSTSDDEDFIEFFSVINNLLRNISDEDAIKNFIESESFSLFEKVGASPELYSEEEKGDLFRLINQLLGSLTDDNESLAAFMRSPDFTIFVKMGELYGED